MCLKIAVTEDQEVTVNRESIREYVVRQRERYQKASRAEKGRILDEVVSVTDYHPITPDGLSARASLPRVSESALPPAWEPLSERGLESPQPREALGRLMFPGYLSLHLV